MLASKHAALFLAVVVVAARVAAADSSEPYPRIRSILFERQEVFGTDERVEIPHLPDLGFVSDAANFLHIQTRRHIIHRELLVHEGEPADPALLEESERNLRALPFLREVRVFTRPAENGEVDVIVRTQDTWTTEPRASYASGGGSTKSELGIVERNLLGFGKTIKARYRSRIDRSETQFLYDDPLLFGSRFRIAGDYEGTSDGQVASGALEYPFFSLETPWAGGVQFAKLREKNRIFAQGPGEISRFTHRGESFRARFGHLLEGSTSSRLSRLGIFYRRNQDEFPSPGTGLEPDVVPRNRRQSVPGVFFHREVVDFAREKHFNLFDRIEDLNLGNILEAEIGYSARGLGALRDEPILTASDRQGFDFGPGHKAFLFAIVSGRQDAGDVRNAVVEFEGVAFDRVELFVEQTLLSRWKLDLGRNLDRDVQLFLGSDNGLRGFSNRRLVGDKRLTFNLEDRLFFVNDLFHLVSLGAVLFFDSGMVWGLGQPAATRNVGASLGIGLRLGAPRAAQEQVWRFDLAFPLTTAGGQRPTPGFSFGSGQAIPLFSGPFDLQTAGGG